jgi:hypothetical protein
MPQYVIMVRPLNADAEVELCRVSNNPEAIVEAALQKKRAFKKDGETRTAQIYEHAYFKKVSK